MGITGKSKDMEFSRNTASANGSQIQDNAREQMSQADTGNGISMSEGIYTGNVTALPSADRREKLRMLEALLFAASEPLDEKTLSDNFDSGEELSNLLEELQSFYTGRGVNLIRVAGKWTFRTADDLSFLLEKYKVQQRKLSRAALETLAIVAYHQPVTRAEIEEIRGVTTSKGTLDVLMETGWIRPRGRRRTPGRPVTYGTNDAFLEHFGFNEIKDLPGLKELKEAGLLEGNLPNNFVVPTPNDTPELTSDEDPLDDPDDNQAALNFSDVQVDADADLDGTESFNADEMGKFGT